MASLLTMAWVAGGALAFSLYPTLDPVNLASALNLSAECLETLNTTLPGCDQTLFSMVGQVDNFWWEDDNVTALCSGNCSSQTSLWNFNVAYDCFGQTLSVGGKLVPADTVSGRYMDGMNIACLSSYDEYSWCLTESQNWVGSDIIRPDCSVTPSDPQCENATNLAPGNNRLANLYSDDVLCSSCFIQMLYTRIVSPFLPDTDYSEYLVDQIQDVGDICSTTIPNITTRALPSYDTAPFPTSQYFGNISSSPTSVSVVPTCTGQMVNPQTQKRLVANANVHHRPVEHQSDVKRQASECDVFSLKYGVTTGDLQTITNSDTCTVPSSICLPAACTLQQVTGNSSCASLSAGIAGTSFNATQEQFLMWNPNIMGLCDQLTEGQYVCISAPGGTYALAPPPLGTNADAGNQQRGGQGGVVTPTTTVTTTVNSVSEAPGPTATQSGIAINCNNYAEAKSGDNCHDFAVSHSIAPAQLYQLNPVLGSNGVNCSTNFWASEYYCIGVATTTSSVIVPGPTQSGIASNCNNFAQAKAGDNCYNFAIDQDLSPAQFYSWNPVLGANGAQCSTQFQAGEYYCIGVLAGSNSNPPPTTTATSVTAPGSTQSGIAGNCNKYAVAKAGDDCYDFATGLGITPAQLYAWNPVLGANGENCSTEFQAGEYYCVGVSS